MPTGMKIKMGKTNKTPAKWTKGAEKLVKKEFYANTPLTREEINAERKTTKVWKNPEFPTEGKLNELMVWLTDQMSIYGPHCEYHLCWTDDYEPPDFSIMVEEPEPESTARNRILARKFTQYKKTAEYKEHLKAAEEEIGNTISKQKQKEQAKRLKEMQLYIQGLDADRREAEAEIAKLVAKVSSE